MFYFTKLKKITFIQGVPEMHVPEGHSRFLRSKYDIYANLERKEAPKFLKKNP